VMFAFLCRQPLQERMSMCLRHAIEVKSEELLVGRHVDVLMICSVYALARLMVEVCLRCMGDQTFLIPLLHPLTPQKKHAHTYFFGT